MIHDLILFILYEAFDHVMEVDAFDVLLHPRHQLLLVEAQPGQQVKRTGQAGLQEKIVVPLHGQLDALGQADVDAQLQHVGEFGHLALVEHQFELREDGGEEVGDFLHEEEQLVEQFFEEGLAHDLRVFFMAEEVVQHPQAVLSRLRQVPQDGDCDDREGATAGQLQAVVAEEVPLLPLPQAQQKLQVVVELFVIELFLDALCGGGEACDVFEEGEGERDRLDQFSQVEVSLEQSAEGEDVVVLDAYHLAQVPPPSHDLPGDVGEHGGDASQPAFQIIDLGAILEVDVFQVGEAPDVAIEQAGGVREVVLEVLEQFWVSGEPVPDEDVGVLLLGVALDAGGEAGVEVEDPVLGQFVHLTAELVEDGQVALDYCLALQCEAAVEGLGADLLAQLVAAVRQHANSNIMARRYSH